MAQYDLSEFGLYLKHAVDGIEAKEKQQGKDARATLHVHGVANAVLFAYEQLRSLSENIEDHLLLQRAILRFYRRNILYSPVQHTTDLATELITELTQAQYLKNDATPLETIAQIQALIDTLLAVRPKLARSKQNVPHKTADKWLFDLLSVRTEQLLQDPSRIQSFTHVALTHFNATIDFTRIVDASEPIHKNEYGAALYIAIHQALLKSDDANARSALNDLYGIDPTNLRQFIDFNKKFDTLNATKSVSKLSRFVTKNGAPLRIIRALYFENAKHPAEALSNTPKTVGAIATQIDATNTDIRRSLNYGIVKSIVFLFITKALIGVVVEVPYDIIVTGAIVLLPLILNLLIPPAFLAVTALTFRRPGKNNKEALITYLEQVLYKTPTPPAGFRYTEPLPNSNVFNIIYTLVFLGALFLVIDRLAALGFNPLQGFIFIIFFSTASYLGYRLTLQIREIEFVQTYQGFIALLRDFLYSPFIFIGRRISYRFSQLNIIAQVLDLAIDLPLKTFVRLLRQWLAFLNSKKDELL